MNRLPQAPSLLDVIRKAGGRLVPAALPKVVAALSRMPNDGLRDQPVVNCSGAGAVVDAGETAVEHRAWLASSRPPAALPRCRRCAECPNGRGSGDCI